MHWYIRKNLSQMDKNSGNPDLVCENSNEGTHTQWRFQLKQNNQLSFPQRDDCKIRKDAKNNPTHARMHRVTRGPDPPTLKITKL